MSNIVSGFLSNPEIVRIDDLKEDKIQEALIEISEILATKIENKYQEKIRSQKNINGG
jgi:hypothetical protein